jgi:hypothetical protein
VSDDSLLGVGPFGQLALVGTVGVVLVRYGTVSTGLDATSWFTLGLLCLAYAALSGAWRAVGRVRDGG